MQLSVNALPAAASKKIEIPHWPGDGLRSFFGFPLLTWCDTQYIWGGNSFTLPHFSNLALPPILFLLASHLGSWHSFSWESCDKNFGHQQTGPRSDTVTGSRHVFTPRNTIKTWTECQQQHVFLLHSVMTTTISYIRRFLNLFLVALVVLKDVTSLEKKNNLLLLPMIAK